MTGDLKPGLDLPHLQGLLVVLLRAMETAKSRMHQAEIARFVHSCPLIMVCLALNFS